MRIPNFESRYYIDIMSWAGISLWLIQDGRGDINTPPNWAEESALHEVDHYRDIYYSFLDKGKPGFTIDTNVDISLFGNYSFDELGITIEGRYSMQYAFSRRTEDLARVADSENIDHFLTISVSFNPARLY